MGYTTEHMLEDQQCLCLVVVQDNFLTQHVLEPTRAAMVLYIVLSSQTEFVIGKSLAHIDWNEEMKSKTATECWNLLRGELDSDIDRYIFL